MTAAKHTRGTEVQVGDGATPTENFTTIAEVKSFDGPSGSAPSVDVSSFDSVKKEKIAALADAGQFQMTMNFIGFDAGQQGLRADIKAGTKRNYRVVFNDHDSDPTHVTFEAFPTALTPSGQTDAAYEQQCTLEVSGDDVWHYCPSPS